MVCRFLGRPTDKDNNGDQVLARYPFDINNPNKLVHIKIYTTEATSFKKISIPITYYTRQGRKEFYNLIKERNIKDIKDTGLYKTN